MVNKRVVVSILILVLTMSMMSVVVPGHSWGTESIVGLWHLDEGSGNIFADSSGNGYGGTVNGATWVDGIVGKALQFDGENGYANVTQTSALHILGDLTVEAFIRPNSVSGVNLVVGHGKLGGTEDNNWIYALIIDEGRVAYYHEYGDAQQVWIKTDDQVVSTGNWYRIAVTRDTSQNQVKIYLNGTIAKSGNYYTPPSGGDSGSLFIGGMNSLYTFDGIIDEVSVWNGVRIYDTLVGSWHFDEGSGITAFDSSEYKNNGTVSGAAWVEGRFDKALRFNGVNDRVVVSTDASLNTIESMTLEAWVKRDSRDTNHVIIGRRTAATSWTYFLMFNVDNTISFAVSKTGDDTGYTLLTTSATYTDTLNWHHVAATYQYVADGTSVLRIYYDAKLVAGTTSAIGPIVSDNVRDVWIGAIEQSGNEQWFNGTIDEVHVWNETRTEQEVRQDAMLDPLVGFWCLDEGSGVKAGDSSSYHNDGTVYGATWVFGRYDKALYFDGINDRVTINAETSLNAQLGLVLEAWVRRDSVGNTQIVFARRTSATSWTYFLRFNNDNTISFAVSKTGDNAGCTALTTPATYSDTANWHHISATYQFVADGTSVMRIYYDGSLVAETAAAVGPIVSDTARGIWIGAIEQSGGEEWFNGTIDEVKIWNEIPKQEAAPLVGLWHFNENSGNKAYDSSKYLNDGALYPLTQGRFAGALRFDGVNDYVRVPDSSSLRVSNNITLEAWIYPTNLTAGVYQVIVHKNNHTLSYRSYYLGLLGNKLVFYLSSDGLTNYQLTSATSIAVNTWTHVVATSDGKTMRLYINGVADANTLAGPATIYTSPANLIIGAYLPDTSGYERHFNGTIDEVRVSNITRTSFNLANQPAVDGDTVALWRFNEETGTTTYDETSNNNTGTVINGATWLVAGPAWVAGEYGGALMFDGINDYVEVPDSSSLDVTGKITLEAWIYPHNVTKNQVIIMKYNHTTLSSSYYLSLTGGKIYFSLTYDGNHYYALTSTANITNYMWSHVAAASNGTHMLLYINGEYDSARAYPPGNIYAGTAALRIGAYLPEAGYARIFDGIIDEVAVFNDFRSLHDIGLSSISLFKSEVGETMNSTVGVNLIAENYGEYPETFNVSLYCDSNLVGSQTVSNLGSKGFATLSFELNTTGMTIGNYTISAGLTPILEEIDKKNNNLTGPWVFITIAGDVTSRDGLSDGKVDMRDVGALCNKFGSNPARADWDINFDTNDDGVVNMRDIGIATNNFGKRII